MGAFLPGRPPCSSGPRNYESFSSPTWKRPRRVKANCPAARAGSTRERHRGCASRISTTRLWWGDSRGHWEGNTLVIDVTNFSGKTNFRGSTDNLHLIERWTRTGPDTLEYVVTVDDPTTWTKPWTAKQEWAKQGDQFNRIYKEPRCVEGNYSIFGWLAGARAKEQAFAEGRGPDPATINYATV